MLVGIEARVLAPDLPLSLPDTTNPAVHRLLALLDDMTPAAGLNANGDVA